jgi:hypothetical protein
LNELIALVFGTSYVEVPEIDRADTRAYCFQGKPPAEHAHPNDPQYGTAPTGKPAAAKRRCAAQSAVSIGVELRRGFSC